LKSKKPWNSSRGWPGSRWDHDHRFPRRAAVGRHRRHIFISFVGLFGLLVLLVLGGMAAVAFLFSRLFGGDQQTAALAWFMGCGLALVLPLLAAALAARAFRGIATPLADVMAAADAVADGDLSARVPVPERGPQEFDRLAVSFNHMAEELERSDQQRRNLTADVAHELRTPLHVIQGNLEGVLDGVYEPTEDHIGATLDETRALARLVEDLRTLSLAEAGQLPLNREPVDVVELLEDTRTSFSGPAETAGIDLRRVKVDGVFVEEGGSNVTVPGDVGRLDQVLGNLMANALRHTPPGGAITLGATTLPDAVRITVRDTGEGISPEDVPFVFDRFWRGDRSRSHASGAGSGLGLAIARQLVRAHGGSIGVESELGEGTTFTVELPANGE